MSLALFICRKIDEFESVRFTLRSIEFFRRRRKNEIPDVSLDGTGDAELSVPFDDGEECDDDDVVPRQRILGNFSNALRKKGLVTPRMAHGMCP
jgi:hypothetical protein